MKFSITFLLLLITTSIFAQNATVSGFVLDKDLKDEPLPFANVNIKGTSLYTTTDINGAYTINIPNGNHEIVFSFVGYESKSVLFSVADNEKKTISQSIGSGSVTMEDVVIKSTLSREKETALLLDQKKAVEIKQSIGAQEMSRKGISDVEEGLTKITGITKVDGRGLFVRGLEDRYNNLLINGLAVPSNNPFKKIIPLDIFPTDIVSVLETYKTFNTNLYGDFAGGTFNIVTSNSGKSQTKVNFGTGFTTKNNLQNFLISEDATSTGDFFGFSGNEREIPKAVGNAPANYFLTSDEAAKGFGSGFDVKEDKSALNSNFGILHTQKFKLGEASEKSFQYLLSLNYDNKYQVRNGVDRFFNLGDGLYDNDLITTQYKFATNSSILGALNYKTKRLSISSNTIFLNTTENTIQDQLGVTNGQKNQPNAFIRLNQLLETKYLNTQLTGKYSLTENERHNIKAGVSYTKTNYEQPDRKSFKGTKIDDNTTSLSYTGNSIARQYFNFDGKLHVSGLLEYNWNFGKEDITKSHKLTLGYNGYMNQMGSSFRFLVSEFKSGTNSITFPTNTFDSLLTNAITSNEFTYKEGSNSTYKATLNEIVNAGYADLAFKFGEKVDLNIGVRAEQTNKETFYKESGDFDAPFIKLKTDKVDILPSLNAKYQLNDKSNLRFAASKTITRPVVMEAYPLEFVNPDATIENGNPLIKNSENYNVDLKYELFPSNKELISITAFSKMINNPIERIFKPNAGSGGQNLTYDNSKKALLYGVELEFLFQLEKISKSLSNFSFGANASLMDTKVEIDPIKNSSETIAQDQNPTRKLQGASPWLINADLKYESNFSKSWKSTMTMVYNIYSKRIFAVGTAKLDNYYEMPYGKLDFIWGNNISEKWDLKLSVDNILNPSYKIEVGDKNRLPILENDLTVKEFKKGVGFSLNLAYTF
jgi:outer membrane receptor protein involved in Fe transport